MTFLETIEEKKKAYTGEIVGTWLKSAYQSGINDLREEMKQQLEAAVGLSAQDDETRVGLLRAIGILEETFKQ